MAARMTTLSDENAEAERLAQARNNPAWRQWGPYLSERQWGTVREDYSENGDAWNYFTHDQSRSRAYRWGEDGIAGISDEKQLLCFALSLWNGHDPILKERLFGLTANEGNHGEDVKEYYFYLDNTPTHSYMRYLYKYPHAAFPYATLVEENRRRTRQDREFELVDTGVFADNRYFDVTIEYAKASPEDILIQITIANRGPEPAKLRVLPTIWFRNTWSWGRSSAVKPSLRRADHDGAIIALDDSYYSTRWLIADGTPELLFTENDTDVRRVFGWEGTGRYFKDNFHRYVIEGAADAVNPLQTGTKAAAHYNVTVTPGQDVTLKLRFTDALPEPAGVGSDFDTIFLTRRREADEFYGDIIPTELSPDAKLIMRQSIAGLLWSKQYYHYIVRDWLDGDPQQPPPPPERKHGRNHEWVHLYNADVISMPDKWEYPWYAAWDLAFHCVALAIVDADFAKDQLTLLLR